MASLPNFHSFNNAAAAATGEQYDGDATSTGEQPNGGLQNFQAELIGDTDSTVENAGLKPGDTTGGLSGGQSEVKLDTPEGKGPTTILLTQSSEVTEEVMEVTVDNIIREGAHPGPENISRIKQPRRLRPDQLIKVTTHTAPRELKTVNPHAIQAFQLIAMSVAKILFVATLVSSLLVLLLSIFSTNEATVAQTVFTVTWAHVVLTVVTGIGMMLLPNLARVINNSKRVKGKGKRVRGKGKRAKGMEKVPSTAYYFYVLGSGGHTTEMMAFIKMSQVPHKNSHRRYLVTSGDSHSLPQSHRVEAFMTGRCMHDGDYSDEVGTADTAMVTRARSVHQSFFSSILTSLKCAFEIISALTTIPTSRAAGPLAKQFQYPNVVITNGPGTGFIVALVILLMKMLFIVPRNSMQVVFIETWARSHKLSLTGKLFYWTKLASGFVVQSEELGKALKVVCIGNINQRWASKIREASEEKARFD